MDASLLIAVPVCVVTVAALLGANIYGLHQASGQHLPRSRNAAAVEEAAVTPIGKAAQDAPLHKGL